MEGLGAATPDRFAAFVHIQISNVIGQLDAKASIVLGLSSASLVYMARDMNVLTKFSSLLEAIRAGVLNISSAEIAVFSSVIVACSWLFSVLAILPRFGRVSGSIAFYRAIARYKSGTLYADEIAAAPSDKLVSSVLSDVHAIARIADSKAVYASWATLFLLVGLSLMIASVLLN